MITDLARALHIGETGEPWDCGSERKDTCCETQWADTLCAIRTPSGGVPGSRVRLIYIDAKRANEQQPHLIWVPLLA